MSSPLPDERQQAILDHLGRNGRVLAAELAGLFGVSEDTVRRDLRDLAEAGLCRRVHGGAMPLSPQPRGIAERSRLAPERKQRLARRAAALVRDAVLPGGLLFLDAGSTNLAVARALPPNLRIGIVTNMPAIAATLAGTSGLEVISIGGRVDPEVGGCLGARALREMSGFRFDMALLGACAVDAEAGLCAFHLEDGEMKRAAAAVAASVAAVATSDKLGTVAPFRVLDPGRLGDLVVEPDVPQDIAAALSAAGTRLHRADPEEAPARRASDPDRKQDTDR
ncbi:DeoR/GlpR family DNA-binding transcription regulator [Rhizosaccharibacter radicis]|uniref:DeoR/GlpR family DNA-binding transcription regulator n=1 Tax=Rhizosaccharibacter radicis TaxID=2782605 RepID=A0ABT1VXN3_9PROT|nr:DeoR/GlpR family DNA-binding transcription regulator [Acetobacteraceae bacterium KSS12]